MSKAKVAITQIEYRPKATAENTYMVKYRYVTEGVGRGIGYGQPIIATDELDAYVKFCEQMHAVDYEVVNDEG